MFKLPQIITKTTALILAAFKPFNLELLVLRMSVTSNCKFKTAGKRRRALAPG
jgi:hypothetical protein